MARCPFLIAQPLTRRPLSLCLQAVEVAVSGAFHTSLMQPAKEALAKVRHPSKGSRAVLCSRQP